MRDGSAAPGVRRVCSALRLLALAVVLASPLAHAGEALVAVAANFTGAMQRVVPLFESATGHRLKTSFGSTGKLYAQIKNGAPFDVFLAADQRRPALLEEQGLTVSGSRYTYAAGRLVLWSVDRSTVDPAGAVLRSGEIERLAIANPKTAPYGAAALEILRNLGVYEALRARLVRGENISQTFQFVKTGNATLGLVALAQVRSLPAGTGSVWIVPQGLYAPIRQDAVLLKRGASNAAARDFLTFLRGPQAQRIIGDLGYGVE